MSCRQGCRGSEHSHPLLVFDHMQDHHACSMRFCDTSVKGMLHTASVAEAYGLFVPDTSKTANGHCGVPVGFTVAHTNVCSSGLQELNW